MLKTIPLVRKNDIVVQELGNELLVYDLKNNRAVSLNETSALVWQLSTGDKTFAEISKIVGEKTKTPKSEELVWLALGLLKRENLLADETKIPNYFQGATRREIIKKIGLVSATMLPVISSIIAPQSISALSGTCSAAPFPLGCNCTVSGDCQSGCCGSNANPPTSSTSFCVTAGQDAPGAVCARNCECSSGCCGLIGPFCATVGSVAPGGSCRLGCACSSGNCGAGNTCV